MLAEFSVTPVGAGVHLSQQVAKAVRVVKESGLDYQLTALGTLLEGERGEVLRVIEKAHQALLESNERVYTRIVLDEFREETAGRIRSKVTKIEKELGVALKK